MNRQIERSRYLFFVTTVATSLFAASTYASIFIDADTPATGSTLSTTPLVTGLGTISFVGQIRDRDTDNEFNAAGAAGNVFDIDDNTHQARLTFSFDVASVTFIYGGNTGVFDMKGLDASSNVVASFYQANTDAGQPAGPVTLFTTTLPIRQLFWQDPGLSFAPIDNVTIVPTPEPEGLIMASVATSFLLARRQRQRFGNSIANTAR